MSVATIERSTIRRTPGVEPEAPTARSTAPVRRRPRRTGPGTGPGTRPSRVVPAPSLAPSRPLRPQSCRAEVPVAPPRSWRLTERGLAVVMVTAVLIVTAAVAVVGLTALRVTSEGYRATGSDYALVDAG